MRRSRVLLNEEEVDAQNPRDCRTRSAKIMQDREIHLICVLKGGVFFMCELAKRITVPVYSGFYVCIQLRR